MTIAVKKNVLAGSGARKSLRYGWEQVPRAFLVTGLSDTTQAVYPSALAAATAADSTFALGQRHPTTGMTLCVAQDVEFTPEGPHAVKVTMTYKRNESVDETTGGGETKPCEIEVGATLQQESTNVDVNGSVMQISYTPTGESMSVPYKGTVSVMRPRRTLTFSRTEATSPAYKASQYVGKVNSGSWPGIETAATAREYLAPASSGGATTAARATPSRILSRTPLTPRIRGMRSCTQSTRRRAGRRRASTILYGRPISATAATGGADSRCIRPSISTDSNYSVRRMTTWETELRATCTSTATSAARQ
jgi:hypothetical protein